MENEAEILEISKKKLEKYIVDYKTQKEKAKARHRKFLANMTAEQREIKRAKDREYYQKKKVEKKTVSITDMPETEKQKQRKQWKENSKKYRSKKKMFTNTLKNTLPDSKDERSIPIQPYSNSSKEAGIKNVENDTKNYLKYKMGYNQKLFVKKEAEPTKFDCQKVPKQQLSDANSSRTATKTKIENDMENYIEWKLTNNCIKRIKKDCTPHKFACQSDRPKRTCPQASRVVIIKRQKKQLLAQTLDEPTEFTIVKPTASTKSTLDSRLSEAPEVVEPINSCCKYCICIDCDSISACNLIWPFPNDEVLKQMWMQNLGICSIIPGYGVCGNHFSASDIYMQDNVVKLKDGAVPNCTSIKSTENVCSPKDPISELNSTEVVDIKEEMIGFHEDLIKEEPVSQVDEWIHEDAFGEVDEKPPELNLAYCCRLCLLPSNQFQEITSSVKKLIYDCTSLDVYTTEEFPKYVCLNCFEKLNAYNEFRKRCHKINTEIHEIITKNSVLIDDETLLNPPSMYCMVTEKANTPSQPEPFKELTSQTLQYNTHNAGSKARSRKQKIQVERLEFPGDNIQKKSSGTQKQSKQLRPIDYRAIQISPVTRIAAENTMHYSKSVDAGVIETEKQYFDCNICLRQFCTIIDLQAHMNIHPETQQSAKCLSCNILDFPSFAAFKKHQSVFHFS